MHAVSPGLWWQVTSSMNWPSVPACTLYPGLVWLVRESSFMRMKVASRSVLE